MVGNSFQRSSKKSLQPLLSATLDKLYRGVELQSSQNIDETLVIEVISELESDGHIVCGHLDPRAYSTIIQMLLGFNDCRHSERGIYLLGAALYYDAHSPSKKRGIKKKKEVIAKECLHLLLNFFVDGTKNNRLRQWVGIMILQLFHECDNNVQQFELGPEQQRRELGNMVLKEPNEIIRMICGQIITSLIHSGVMLEHLWPVHIDKQLYAGFPITSHSSRGWNQQFQNYMDSAFEIMEPTDSIGQVFFAQNVSLTPPHNFGPEDHNLVIVIENCTMTIWTGAVTDSENFDHCLEIPLALINRMIVNRRAESQLSGVLNVHLFLNTTDLLCYLDCVGTVLNQICMVQQESFVEDMRHELQVLCPDLEIINDDNYGPQGSSNQNCQEEATQNNQQNGRSIDAVLCGSHGTSVVRSHLMSAARNKTLDPSSEILSGKRTGHGDIPSTILLCGGSFKSLGEQIEAIEQPIDNESRQSPKMLSAKPMEARTPAEPKMTNRKGTSVPKPKAKTPLRQTQKSKDAKEVPFTSKPLPLADELPSNGLSHVKIEDYVSKLASQFPLTDASTRRAVVLASNGNYEAASKLLAESVIDRNSAHGAIEDATKVSKLYRSTTGPKASKTSKLGVAESSTVGQRRRKTTTAEPKSQRQTNSFEVQEDGQKKYSPKETLNNQDRLDSCYDIPPDGYCEEQSTRSNNVLERTIKPAQSVMCTSKKMVRKATAKNTRSKKAGRKNRQSAPAAPEFPTATRRYQRIAAAVASTKLKEADASNEELDEANEALESKIHHRVQKSKKPATDKPNTPGDDATMIQQQSDVRFLELIQDDFSAQHSDDLYGASPRKPAARPIQEGCVSNQPPDDLYSATPRSPAARAIQVQVPEQDKTSNAAPHSQEFQSLSKMAAKMDKILGHLGDEPNYLEVIRTNQDVIQRQNLPKGSSNVPSNKALVNDYLCRKTPVISFNDRGARNQGFSATLIDSNGCPQVVGPARPTSADAEPTKGRKRKREQPVDIHNGSLVKKRQSISPNSPNNPVQGNRDLCFGSSPPALLQIEKLEQNSGLRRMDSSSTRQRISKPISQGSRVDQNGSPRPRRSTQIDRIGRVKRKLLEDYDTKVDTPKSIHQRTLITASSSEIFGPKLRLGSIPKAYPSSPLEKEAPRYIPHKKNRDGFYEGLNSNEIIDPSKALMDPFIGKSTHSSGFKDRLLFGSTTIAGRKQQQQSMHPQYLERVQVETTDLPSRINKYQGMKSIVKDGASKIFTGTILDHNRQMHAKPVNTSHSDRFSLPEMTIGSTDESRSPLAGKAVASKIWNIALRPHYTSLSETIHHIADEVIIRLAKEEDAMRLIANQYEENGGKILHQLEEKRRAEKDVIIGKMDRTKTEMAALYAEAKGLADRTRRKIQECPLSSLEHQWTKDSEALQARIDQGRLGSGIR